MLHSATEISPDAGYCIVVYTIAARIYVLSSCRTWELSVTTLGALSCRSAMMIRVDSSP